MQTLVAYFARRWVENSTMFAAVPATVLNAALGILYIDWSNKQAVVAWSAALATAIATWAIPDAKK